MLSDTLSPAWCECLLFDQVLLEGTREELERDPPLIIINIFDYDSMVTLTFFSFFFFFLLYIH